MFWSALILGFLGSLHCVVMCGPIALTMPGQKTLNQFLWSRILYNIGRVMTYALIGLILGLIGELVGLSGYQRAFSIILGAIMILLAFSLSGLWLTAKPNHWMIIWSQKLKSSMKRWIKSNTMGGAVVLGVINGFLPCGLVYVAVIGAIAFADLGNSIQYMVAFGMGTFPAMLAVSLSGRLFNFQLLNISRVSNLFVFILGLLLTIRGLNLDIPYLSPLIGLVYPDITICN